MEQSGRPGDEEESPPGEHPNEGRHASIGVPRQCDGIERRVALVPKVIQRLRPGRLVVLVETGAGEGAFLGDALYTSAGARIGDPYEADVVVSLAPPDREMLARLRAGTTLIGLLGAAPTGEIVDALDRAGVTAYALERIPRISRAQSMDALSSQATVAGYQAVLAAARLCTRFFPMLTTAAGTVQPASVLVLGAGVAGLQALATAKRLGARASGYDVRPEVADQVRSVGARWLDLGIDATGSGGYARTLTDDETAEQARRLTEAIAAFDVVITTALVPGRPAPRLVSAEAVAGMRPGAVVLDLAAEAGGNCELSRADEIVVHDGVSIAAPTNLPAAMPEHASELFARNVTAFLDLLIDDDGGWRRDPDDEVLDAARLTRADAPRPAAAVAAEA